MHASFSKLPIIVEDFVRDKGGFYNCAHPSLRTVGCGQTSFTKSFAAWRVGDNPNPLAMAKCASGGCTRMCPRVHRSVCLVRIGEARGHASMLLPVRVSLSAQQCPYSERPKPP